MIVLSMLYVKMIRFSILGNLLMWPTLSRAFNQQNFGWSNYSRLGQLIADNIPTANNWQIELLTIEDCVATLKTITNLQFRSIIFGIFYELG